MSKTLVVGIAGGTGSGKTTFTRAIAERLGTLATVLTHDDYYRAQHELSYEERTKVNYDHPDAYETDLLVRHLAALRRGEAIEVPVYDFSIYDRTSKVKVVAPAPVIVVEGIMIFHERALRDQFDIKVFVDTDADVRILRRALRDVTERGRSFESVIDQYLRTVKPMHEAFVEPTKRYADIIVPMGGENAVAQDAVVALVNARR